ncbi:GTP pyrophosphokinase family protein [Isoptericola sp. NEAU-Y5]|uniref:GTP pyrophosphokinase family protein n=1 Tax=Isoptericola luteus TaxID=2879484 RepID=A0ABS7ZG74_9MICO|nr:GTP pyrophosphokinase family protein [Isoptericola sp. NEAU-Y5]MCA5894008.1 GTP pyrophosphokinase family protein [Isoptericola sp. NEAU-Y5]
MSTHADGIAGHQTPEAAQIRVLVGELRRLALTYKFGIDEVMTKVGILRDEFRHMQHYNPVEHVTSRLKSLESIVAKCRRKGIPLTPQGVREQMFDVAGVRITCSFVADIYRVRDMLVGQPDLTVLEERDYIAHPKPNGYKSLHLIVQVPVYLSDRTEDVVVEIQLRTIAMDFWASLEHKIYYKYSRDVPAHLTDALKLAADVAASLDTSMERIHDEVRAISGEEEPVEQRDGLLSPEEMLRSFWTSTDSADDVVQGYREL